MWWLVDRPNLFMKIPATLAGLPAITETLAAGISVNVTVMLFGRGGIALSSRPFSERLEQRLAGGRVFGRTGERSDPFVVKPDRRRGRPPTGCDDASWSWERRPPERGKAATCEQQPAYDVYEETKASPRWRSLEAKGGHMQRLL